ncbi:MAG: FliH/SctL family protein [Thermoguttaceae bacterium]|jgi:flagellar assembly protein FliH
MSTIIKATDGNRGVQHVTFNFDDMAAKANAYLEKVQAEAAGIIAQARTEAASIKKQAEIEGRKAGEAAIEKTVQTQLSKQVATLLPALREAVGELRKAKQAWLGHWEKSAVHVATAIAGRVLRNRLPPAPDVTLTLIREALELAAGSPHVRIHLSPADHQTLGGHVQTLAQELTPMAAAELVSDAEIAPGGCRVETRFGTIDQRFEAQLARIEEELT